MDLRTAAGQNDVLDQGLAVVDDHSPCPTLIQNLFKL
jgi:hypothetical protein